MGSGVLPLAMTTRPGKGQGADDGKEKSLFMRGLPLQANGRAPIKGIRAAIKPVERLVPVGWRALPPLHPRPIDVMVCHGSHGETWF